jgi:competence protein ComEA
MPVPMVQMKDPEPLRLDLNRASPEALDRLPGIGPKLARAIVDLRGRSGPFKSVDGLSQVPGLGHSRLKKLRPHLFIGAP